MSFRGYKGIGMNVYVRNVPALQGWGGNGLIFRLWIYNRPISIY